MGSGIKDTGYTISSAESKGDLLDPSSVLCLFSYEYTRKDSLKYLQAPHKTIPIKGSCPYLIHHEAQGSS